MLYIYTHFNYRKNKPLPLVSVIMSGEKSKSLVFYYPKTGDSLYEIEKRKDLFKKVLGQGVPIKINDYKSHMSAFNLDPGNDSEIYDYDPFRMSLKFDSLDECKEGIQVILEQIPKEPNVWENLIAEASKTYEFLERRGLSDGVKIVHPKYHYAITGRSKTLDFNIQGETSPYVKHPSWEYDTFVHLDWISADIRTAALISGDKLLEEACLKSDPYTIMADALNSGDDTEISRDQCKVAMLKAIYSLDVDSPVIGFYSGLSDWMRKSVDEIRDRGYSETILGRRFHSDSRDDKSVFNAIIQGTVAHAMQNVIIKFGSEIRDFVVAEIHDSIVLACNKPMLKQIIEYASGVMTRPLDGLVDSNPFYPLRVSVGKHWRQWKFLKEYRP